MAAAGIGLPWPSKLATTERCMTSPSARSSIKTIKKSAGDSFGEAQWTFLQENFTSPTRKANRSLRRTQCKTYCTMQFSVQPVIEMSTSESTSRLVVESYCEQHGVAEIASSFPSETLNSASAVGQNALLMDLDPTTAKTLITILGPFLSAFSFLFILRIVMSWYPKLPVEKFPYSIVYAPTEPLLVPTRKLIPPLAGVDVTPVVWFGLLSFLNEILLGPQGLLVLLSQKINP